MITLHGETVHAEIDEQGAWLTELTTMNGPVLFTRRQLKNENGELKNRGGSHVCLPNFGPGGESGLSQHGFGRDSLWRLVSGDGTTVALEMTGTERYEAMHAILTYSLSENSLTTELKVENTGDAPFHVAPGFHPYFATGDNEALVSLNGKEYHLDNLKEAQLVQAEAMEIVLDARTIRVTQENLSTWAIWSDCLDNYFCVEPTYGGFVFDSPDFLRGSVQVGTDKAARFAYKITW